jgi:hypothetical protein
MPPKSCARGPISGLPGVSLEPIAPSIGSVIHGVDLANLSDDEVAYIRQVATHVTAPSFSITRWHDDILGTTSADMMSSVNRSGSSARSSSFGARATSRTPVIARGESVIT